MVRGLQRQPRPEKLLRRFGVEPKAFLTIRTQMEMPEDERRAFITERSACIVSRDLAKKLELKVGDRVTLKGDIYPVDLQLTLRGIFDDPTQKTASSSIRNISANCCLSLAGISRAPSPSSSTALTMCHGLEADRCAVRQTRPIHQNRVRAAVCPQLRFLSRKHQALPAQHLRSGDLHHSAGSGNTMAMSVRERIKEVGVLKTLGFTNNAIFGSIIGEAAVDRR